MEQNKNVRSTYKLICTKENGETVILSEGSIENIEQYIFNSNIKDLKNLVSVNFEKIGNYFGILEFKITYNKNGLKEKPILFKNNIKSLTSKNITNKIIEKYINNQEFRNDFLNEYIYPLKDIQSNKRYNVYVQALYNDQLSESKFEKLLYAIVTKEEK